MYTKIPILGLLVGAMFMAMTFLAPPAPALALDARSGTTVTVPAGQTVEDDLVATGETVTIAGRVTGDVYAFARTVVVTGTIDGDLIAAGEQVTLEGAVLGDVRVGASQVAINGQVGKNVTAGAGRVDIGPRGQIGGSVLAGTNVLASFGSVGRGVTVGGSSVQIAGTVGESVQASVGTLTVEPGAKISGAVVYEADQEAAIPAGAAAGPVTFTQRPIEPPQQESPLFGLFDVGGLIWLAGSALLGILLVKLFPRAADGVVQAGRRHPLQSFAMGLALLIAVPVVALLLAITLIGLPLTLGLTLLYGLALLVAWPALGLVMGALLAMAVRRGAALHTVWLLLIGLLVLHVLTHVPVVGGILTFLGLVFGLGVLGYTAWAARRTPREISSSAPAPAV
jgi:cytoskeletal protein CcmA (bactofilin family)